MENNYNTSDKTLGERLRSARKEAGLTQEQLAEKLMVSRQAITKWESGKGIPDIENLKALSQLFAVSIDALLDNKNGIDFSVMRESINLDEIPLEKERKGLWSKKAIKKGMVVRRKYPNGEIHYLVGKQILTKAEKIIDNVVCFVFDGPFGVPDFINGAKNLDKEFFLVNDADRQYLVTVFDTCIESRQLPERMTARKFTIGNFVFVDRGGISPLGEDM